MPNFSWSKDIHCCQQLLLKLPASSTVAELTLITYNKMLMQAVSLCKHKHVLRLIPGKMKSQKNYIVLTKSRTTKKINLSRGVGGGKNNRIKGIMQNGWIYWKVKYT